MDRGTQKKERGITVGIPAARSPRSWAPGALLSLVAALLAGGLCWLAISERLGRFERRVEDLANRTEPTPVPIEPAPVPTDTRAPDAAAKEVDEIRTRLAAIETRLAELAAKGDGARVEAAQGRWETRLDVLAREIASLRREVSAVLTELASPRPAEGAGGPARGEEPHGTAGPATAEPNTREPADADPESATGEQTEVPLVERLNALLGDHDGERIHRVRLAGPSVGGWLTRPEIWVGDSRGEKIEEIRGSRLRVELFTRSRRAALVVEDCERRRERGPEGALDVSRLPELAIDFFDVDVDRWAEAVSPILEPRQD